jgi:hypothetical protein
MAVGANPLWPHTHTHPAVGDAKSGHCSHEGGESKEKDAQCWCTVEVEQVVVVPKKGARASSAQNLMVHSDQCLLLFSLQKSSGAKLQLV